MNKYVWVLMCLFLTGCAVISYERTDDEIAKNISGQCLETVSATILHGFCGQDRKVIREYWENSSLPTNKSDLDSKIGEECPAFINRLFSFEGLRVKYISELPKGTKLKVVKVQDTAMGDSGRRWKIWGSIYGTEEKYVELSSWWFEPYRVDNKLITINTPYIRYCE